MMEEIPGFWAAPSPLEYSRPSRKREGEETRNFKTYASVTMFAKYSQRHCQLRVRIETRSWTPRVRYVVDGQHKASRISIRSATFTSQRFDNHE